MRAGNCSRSWHSTSPYSAGARSAWCFEGLPKPAVHLWLLAAQFYQVAKGIRNKSRTLTTCVAAFGTCEQPWNCSSSWCSAFDWQLQEHIKQTQPENQCVVVKSSVMCIVWIFFFPNKQKANCVLYISFPNKWKAGSLYFLCNLLVYQQPCNYLSLLKVLRGNGWLSLCLLCCYC